MQKSPVQRITPCLCFNDQAEAAVNFYVALFSDAKIIAITRCGPGEFGGPEGSVRTILFELFGARYLAVNGGPYFKFSEAVSFMVNCETQVELDHFWRELSAGGREVQCGWLQDRFGVSWQVVPAELERLMSDPDKEKVQRVTQAMLKMVKLDMAALRAAFDGRG